jgi:hypothetical protein
MVSLIFAQSQLGVQEDLQQLWLAFLHKIGQQGLLHMGTPNVIEG